MKLEKNKYYISKHENMYNVIWRYDGICGRDDYPDSYPQFTVIKANNTKWTVGLGWSIAPSHLLSFELYKPMNTPLWKAIYNEG